MKPLHPHSAPPVQHTDSKDVFPFAVTVEKHSGLFGSVGYKGKVRKVGLPIVLPLVVLLAYPLASSGDPRDQRHQQQVERFQSEMQQRDRQGQQGATAKSSQDLAKWRVAMERERLEAQRTMSREQRLAAARERAPTDQEVERYREQKLRELGLQGQNVSYDQVADRLNKR